MPRDASDWFGIGRRTRFGPLLLALSVVGAFGPPIAELERGPVAMAALFGLLVVASLVAVAESIAARAWLLALAVVVVAGELSLPLRPHVSVVVAVGALRCVFLAIVTAAVLRHVARVRRVTRDTIVAGICGYLLIGLVFHSVFGIVEVVHPGSFRDGDVAISDLPGADRSHGRYPALVYYSFVTLSTVGFGDVTPTWSLPQALSASEAVIGQLYLAILVASLVGMRLAAQPSDGGR